MSGIHALRTLGSDLYRPGQPVGRTAAQARAFVAAWRAAVGAADRAADTAPAA